MSTWSMISLQDANSPMMENLTMFHDHIMTINILITMLVLYIIVSIYLNKIINRTVMQNQLIELIWTFIPMIILFFMAFPSIKILYLMDEIFSPVITIKCMGHQWYWSYEYSDFSNIEFDSFMIPTEELNNNEFRLLDVNNRMVIPFNTYIRLLISSVDVIHSWTIPAVGIKVDATPGRINQASLLTIRPGLYYGQCSEICGANHSFMPIVIESTNPKLFISWIKNFN
uniref:Cytochrome c oxidase subunit 2 n=1 Tax=Calameuta filiformis TaxID=222804 RepID=A0A0S1S658_9HYME|nr:cytochrome c oxidase subunit II [Calameuta filiformis]ALM04130.1 cytochrome c oxidase subunit II [Calameuta filiformis]